MNYLLTDVDSAQVIAVIHEGEDFTARAITAIQEYFCLGDVTSIDEFNTELNKAVSKDIGTYSEIGVSLQEKGDDDDGESYYSIGVEHILIY